MEGQQLSTGDFDVRISDSSNRTSTRNCLFVVHGEQEMIAKVAKYAKLVNFKSWHPQVVSLVAVYQKTEYTSHSMSKYICQEYTNGA